MNPDAIFQGLVQRGLPPHVAEGIVWNLQDESGLDPGINEAAPTVPGSRGGFGLAQWTGPRRVALEAYARDRGAPVDDLDVQLDFLVDELHGPEQNALSSLMASRNPQEAAAAFVRDYERPAQQHLDRRVAEYSGGNALGSYADQPQRPDMNALMALLDQQQQPQMPQLWGGNDPNLFMNKRTFG